IFSEYPDARYEELMERHTENFKRNVRNRNNFLAKETLLYMSINEAPNEEAIELYREQLIPLDKAKNPFFLSRDYENLSFLYTETGQHRQATEAMNESMKYYKEFVNAQTEEQRQLAEVKFETEKKENELRLAETKNMLFLSFGIFAISLSIFLVIYFVKRHTRIRLEKENAELQRKIAEQQAKRKEYEVEMTQRKLEASGMQVAKKDKTLEKISQKTEDSEIKKLIRDDKAGDKSYDDYSKIFGEIHPGFFEALNNRADPQKLTALEQRYCAYIYMHKSNKEIADELNITQNTVKSNKSELKRKLKIDRNTDFEEFLRNIVP
ncbi:MAG: LuxR C-terminal-related transcriptional regulator, partial [Tannerella sp.]|nr:LuxR C-terminal-related transcriptional regulator [Tannerella sp.]